MDMDLEKLSLLIGLIVSIVTAVPSIIQAVRTTIKLIKEKNWKKVMAIIDKAVAIAEATQKSGAQKKADVIAAVTAECKELNINIDIQQVSDYIDEIVDWFNTMQGRKGDK